MQFIFFFLNECIWMKTGHCKPLLSLLKYITSQVPHKTRYEDFIADWRTRCDFYGSMIVKLGFNTLNLIYIFSLKEIRASWKSQSSLSAVNRRCNELLSSSSCCAGSTDIPDPLFSLSFTFPYRSSPQVGLLNNIPYPHIVAECMFVLVVLLLHGHVWVPQEYITYEFVPASPAVSCMSGSSNLNSFRDRRQVAVQLVSCGVLPPRLVQDCSQHSCVIAV